MVKVCYTHPVYSLFGDDLEFAFLCAGSCRRTFYLSAGVIENRRTYTMRKKAIVIIGLCLVLAIIVLVLLFQNSTDEPLYDKNQKINARDIPWEVKMGVTEYGDRALMINFTNNSDYTIKEISLELTMLNNIKSEELESFYSYIANEYELSDDDLSELKSRGLTMSTWIYLLEDEYLKPGESVEDAICYGYKYIKTMDYYHLFQPDMLEIVYLDELGEEHTVFYDYINRTYSNK